MGQGGGGEASSKMVAISYGSQVRLWGVSEDGTRTDVGELHFPLKSYRVLYQGTEREISVNY